MLLERGRALHRALLDRVEIDVKLLDQREERLRPAAFGEDRQGHILRVNCEAAEFQADPSAADVLVLERGETFLRETGAVGARQRPVFDQLDGRIGIAHDHAAVGCFGHHVAPRLARRGRDGGHDVAFGRRPVGVAAFVAACREGQSQWRSDQQGKNERRKVIAGQFLRTGQG